MSIYNRQRTQPSQLEKSARSIRGWSGFLAFMGFASAICGMIAGFAVAKETSQLAGVIVAVAGVLQGLFWFAIASGLGGIAAVCDRLDQ